MNRRTFVSLGLALILGLGALGTYWLVVGEAAPDQGDLEAVVEGNNQFAVNLYAQLSKQDENLVFSPLSISAALSMTQAGAKGQTAEQMAKTLHFGLPPEKWHPTLGYLIRQLNSKGKKGPYQLSVANALWGQQGFAFVPEFMRSTNTQYGAGLQELDFAGNAEAARQVINRWVEKETQDKIKELFKPGSLHSNTRLVLTNAIYFKGRWKKEFIPSSTQQGTFTLTSGATVQVPLMQKSETLPLLEGETFQAVKIPYKGNGFSLIIFLPKAHNGLAELEQALTPTNIANWLRKMTEREIGLTLPKFKMTAEFDLNKVLADMGMPLAFTPEADFSGMSSQDQLFLDAAVHKAFLNVDEEGSEAAAATGVAMSSRGLPPQFRADHPFVFLIQEHSTNSILFMGRLNDPSK